MATKSKNGIPVQEYELLNIAMQGIDKGAAPYELVFKAYTSLEDGKEKCFIELQLNGKYQGSTKGIDIKYKSIFNGLGA